MQCAYDTPGLVVAAYALMVQRETLTIQEIVKNLDGVFSRCNGYRSVVEALQFFEGSTNNEKERLEEKFSEQMKVAPTYPLIFKGNQTSWTTVKKIEDAMKYQNEKTKLFYGIPNAINMGGSVVSINNDGGVVVNDSGILFNRTCTITNLVENMEKKLKGLTESRQQFGEKILSVFDNIGSTQIRNSTTVGDALEDYVEVGLLCFTLQSSKNVDKKSITIPWISNNERFGFEKVSDRVGNSPAVACASMKLQLSSSSVTKISLFVSSGDKKVIEAKKSVSLIMQKSNVTGEIKQTLEKDIGSVEDCLLLVSLIKKTIGKLKRNEKDEAEVFEPIKSTQFQEFVHGLSMEDIEPIGKPFPHAAGLLCGTGQAVFVDDMPCYMNELFMEFFYDHTAHAKIKKVDASKGP